MTSGDVPTSGGIEKGMKYCCRPRLLKAVIKYELADDGLICQRQFAVTGIRFVDIEEIYVFKERRFGSSRSYWACTILAEGQKFNLTAGHRLSLTRTEDRTSTYIPFIKEFERRAIGAKPGLRFIVDEYRETLGTRIYSRVALCAVAGLSRLPRRLGANLCAGVLCGVGPLLRGNRYAHRQLMAAFPTLSTREIRRLQRGMWENIGRTFSEYAHISELIGFSPDTPLAGQVIMDERTAALTHYFGRDRRGALLFAAHLGNWEIPAMAARGVKREIALVYKRLPSAALTAELLRRRALFAARLIEGRPTALREIVRALRDGLLVGMLVDQHYAEGVEVVFFGHNCRVNPAMALLARSGSWPIFGARVIRLPDQRHRFELVGPLELPRNSEGEIDIQATMQAITSILETWIRQQPEQWMWIHRLIR